MIVISVIAVLAAMLLPAIWLVRSSAHTATCANNLRQLGLATLTYPTDHDGYLPPALIDWSRVWGDAADRGIIWQVLRDGGYLPTYGDVTTQEEYQMIRHPELRCPTKSRQDEAGGSLSYSTCGSLLGSLAEGNPLALASIKRIGSTVLAAEVAHASFSWWPAWFEVHGWSNANHNGVFTGWSAPHRRSTNLLLTDGRVILNQYQGGYFPAGAAFFAIDEPDSYRVKMHLYSGPYTDDQLTWFRE